jgi:hypothetical protein
MFTRTLSDCNGRYLRYLLASRKDDKIADVDLAMHGYVTNRNGV